MNTRSDNPIAASPSPSAAMPREAMGEVPSRRVRAADMVKAEIAANAREFYETIHAERLIARRGDNLSTEELG
ncbi:MAG: hypothetical protein WBQ14_08695 [Gaiellaceae bacterium]